jgi:hypothetical protein
MSEHADAHTNPSFSLSNRIARAVWNVVYVLLFRFSPRPLHAWRAFLLRCLERSWETAAIFTRSHNLGTLELGMRRSGWNRRPSDHLQSGDDPVGETRRYIARGASLLGHA